MHSESLTLCMLGNISCFCCRLLTFTKNSFRDIIRVSNGFIWIQISTDNLWILSVLIWVQTVCKGYQQMTKERGSSLSMWRFTVLLKKTFSCNSFRKLNYFHNKPHTLTFNISAHTLATYQLINKGKYYPFTDVQYTYMYTQKLKLNRQKSVSKYLSIPFNTSNFHLNASSWSSSKVKPNYRPSN